MELEQRRDKFTIIHDGHQLGADLKESDITMIIDTSKDRNEPSRLFLTRCHMFGLDGEEMRTLLQEQYAIFLHNISADAPDAAEEVMLEPDDSFTDILSSIEHSYQIDVISTVMAQDFNERNPAWLCLIAPPSSGKSYDLKMCSNNRYAELLDSLTDNALAAGRANTEMDEMNDVFSRMSMRTVIFNDMGSIFGDKQDKISKIVGYLTTAFGGDFSRADPTETRQYDTRMGVIMGMTPRVFYKNLSHFNDFGNRFLVMKYIDDDWGNIFDDDEHVDTDHLREQITRNIEAARRRDWSIPFDDDVKDALKKYVRDIIKLRGCIEAKTIHDLEKPSRLFNQLKNLMRSHARLHNKSSVDMDDFKFVKPLAYLTIPYIDFLYYIWLIGMNDEGLKRRYADGLRNAKKLGILGTEVIDIRNAAGSVIGHDCIYNFRENELYDEIMEHLSHIEYFGDSHYWEADGTQ